MPFKQRYPGIDYNEQENDRFLHKLKLHFVKWLNLLLITVPFAFTWYVYYVNVIKMPFIRRGNWVLVGLYLLIYTVLCHLYGGTTISIFRLSEIVYSQALAFLISDCFIYIVIALLARKFLPILPFIGIPLVQLVISIVWGKMAQLLYFSLRRPLRTVVISNEPMHLHALEMSEVLTKRFQIVGTPFLRDCIADPEQHLSMAEAVFLFGIQSHDRNQILKYCVASGIRVYLIPRVGDVVMSSAQTVHMLHLPIQMVERFNPAPEYLFVKRLFDILISGIVLIALSPLMLVVSLLIRRDGGTAFYRQERLTKNGKTFEVIKFRSMRMDAEKDGVARLSSGTNDDRITPIGRFIRSCRIDELPQLFNILLGDMSIVGPRPERPEIAEAYEEKMPEFCLRLQAKAGLTGRAQVFGKYNSTPYEKLLMDLQYIAHPSIFEDLKIIFATVKILFLPESTEGVAEGQTTAMKNNDTLNHTI